MSPKRKTPAVIASADDNPVPKKKTRKEFKNRGDRKAVAIASEENKIVKNKRLKRKTECYAKSVHCKGNVVLKSANLTATADLIDLTDVKFIVADILIRLIKRAPESDRKNLIRSLKISYQRHFATINIMHPLRALGQGGGGTAKGGGKCKSGGGSVVVRTVTVKKDKKCQKVEDNGHLILLRTALFEESGKDKDVTAGLAKSLMRFNRNGLDLQIEFCTLLQSTRDINKCFDLCKDNMEERYDASGYGWDDEDKLRELTEPGARFLLVREWPVDGENEQGELVGFLHFRFTVLGEVIDSMVGQPCLHVYDIHLEDDIQRKGLGKHLLTVLELIARREKMAMLSLAVQLNDEVAEKWVVNGLRGFKEDSSLTEHGFDAEMEGFRLFSKSFPKTVVPSAQPASVVPAVAVDTSIPSPPSTKSENSVPQPPPEAQGSNISTPPKEVVPLSTSSPCGATDTESVCENSFSSDGSAAGWIRI